MSGSSHGTISGSSASGPGPAKCPVAVAECPDDRAPVAVDIDDKENDRIAFAIRECLSHIKNKRKLAKVAGIGKSTLYGWASGLEPVPAYAITKLAHAMVAIGKPNVACVLIASVHRTREVGLVVAPYLRPARTEELISAATRSMGSHSKALAVLARALEDGRISQAEASAIVEAFEESKRDSEGVSRAAQSLASVARIGNGG